MPVSIITAKYVFYKIFIQGYTDNRTAPVIPASGAYIFQPLFPDPLPVSLIRRM
jgi:hypothetical protein